MNKYYTECKGSRFAIMAVDHASEILARESAARESMECFHVLVWDCTQGPIGRLVATYVRGVEK